MKPEIENLKYWMSGKSTTGYQRALAMREFEQLLTYVAELEKLRQPPVSGSLPQEIEDACVQFGIYVYAHNCNVDEAGVNVELVKEDYKRYLAGRQ